MMKRASGIMVSLFCLLLLAGSFSLAGAAPISYEGSIGNPMGSVFGKVYGHGWSENIASQTDFWSFEVGAGGMRLDIWAQRLDTGLDSVFSLYSGTTEADESEFMNRASFGGMTFLQYADDEITSEGPYGDPALCNIFLDKGTYTLAMGGFASAGKGPFAYELSIGNPGDAPVPDSVPLPAAFWLLGSGLAGLVSFKKLRNLQRR